MSMSLIVKGYTGKNNPEFLKHYKAVKFCNENGLSFPKETHDFFAGKIDGEDLEVYIEDTQMRYIENGMEIELKFELDGNYKKIINVKDLPSECEQIIIEII